MPRSDAQLNVGVKYNVDQSSINAVKKSLQDLQKIKPANFAGTANQLAQVITTAETLQKVLTQAFNADLNTVNIDKFNQKFQGTGLTIEKVQKDLMSFGPAGQKAFNQFANSILTSNLQLKQTNSLINTMGTTMLNTVKWGVASSIMNTFTNSVRQAFDYVKALDSSLNDIRIVTKQSNDEMAQFAVQANNAAQSLGRSTMDYTKAALTFYQQGLGQADVQARTEATLKAQNITGAGDQMADYLTAVWNGYKVANEEAELYVDKLAAVADSSASNMSQLAVAMSKVASSANLLGVPVDKLNAQIATITATTRQAPESVGNALKTIYSRINDIATGADDAQISLGNYSKKMLQVGISVLDANGRLRDTGDVMDEIGNKWQTLSHEQQIYLARTMAGQRQYNNLLALFENWGKYSDLVNISMQAQGATAQKNAIYMDSLAAKMEQLGAAGERVKSVLINEEDLKGLVSLGTNLVNLFASFIDSIGGGGNALLSLSSIITQVFNNVISRQINNIVTNMQAMSNNANQLKADLNLTNTFRQLSGDTTKIVNDLVNYKTQIQGLYKNLSAQEINTYNNLVQNVGQIAIEKDYMEKIATIAESLDAEDSFNLLGSGTGDFEAFKNSLTEAQAKIGDIIRGPDSFNVLVAKVKELQNSLGTEKFTEFFNSGKDSIIDIQAVLRDSAGDAKVLGRALFEAYQYLKNADPEKARQFAMEAQKLGFNLDDAKSKLEAYMQKLQQVSNIKVFVQMAGAIAGVASAINSVVNLTKIWSDKNKTTGEKLLQTFMALGQVTSMLTLNSDKLIRGLATIASKMLASTSATAANTGATIANTGATEAGTVANSGYAASFAIIGKAIHTFLPQIALVAAVIGTVVGVIKLAYDAYNKESIAAKKAAQIARESKETYDDLKSSYDGLKSSIEDYNSAQDAISEMTKGTQQWRDAIRESNDAVLELIQNYPDLAKAVKNVNGQLIISQQAQQEALERAAAGVDAARIASIAASDSSRQADLKADAREAGRFIGLSNKGNLRAGEGVSGVSSDDILKVAAAYSSNFSSNTEKMVSAIAKQTDLSESTVSAIIDEVDNLQELGAQLEANTQATKLAYQSVASEGLQGNKLYEGLDQLEKRLMQTIAGRNLQNKEEQIAKDILERYSFTHFSQGSQQLLQRYNAATGQNASYASNAITAGENVHLIINGQDVTYSKEQIAATIAASEALQQLGNTAQKTAELLGDIDKTGQGKVLKDFIGNQGFGNLSKEQFDNIDTDSLDQFFEDHAEELGYDTADEFRESFEQAQNAAAKDWARIGQHSLNSVKEGLDQLFADNKFSLETSQNIEKAFDNAFEQLGKKGIGSLSSIFKSSGQDAEALAEIFANADFTTSSGLKQLEQTLKGVGDGSFVASEQWKLLRDEIANTHFENPLDTIFNREASAGKITKDIKKYSIISQEDYNTLLEINPKIDQLFTRVAQGYQFVGKKGSLIELITGGTNGYIQAANNFDNIKDSAKQVADFVARQFGQQFEATAFEGVDLSVAANVLKAKVGDNNQLWSALGFNDEYLQDQIDRYQELSRIITSDGSSGRGVDPQVRKEYEALQAELQRFLGTAADADTTVEGLSEQLRTAAALGAQSFRELNSMLANAEISASDYALALEKVSDTQAQSYGLDVDKYEDYVSLLRATREEFQGNEAVLRQVALAEMRVSEGTKDLIDNWDNYSNAFNDFKASGDISDLVDVWGDFSETFANLFDISEDGLDLLGPDFVAQHLDKLEEVKDGVDGAYEDMQDSITARMKQLAIQGATELQNSTATIFENYSGVGDNLVNQVQEAFNTIEQLDPQIPQLTIMANTSGIDMASADLAALTAQANAAGGDIAASGDAMIAAFTQIAKAAGWSSEQAIEAFKNMGYDIQVQGEQGGQEQTDTTSYYYKPPTYKTEIAGYQDLGFSGTQIPIQNVVVDQPGDYVAVPGKGTSFKPGHYAIKSITKRGSQGGDISRRVANAPSRVSPPKGGGSGRSGGGGSTAKPSIAKTNDSKVKRNQKQRTYDPYEQIDKSLQRQSDILDQLQNKQKHLSGAERYNNLQKQNDQLAKQAELLEERIRINKEQAGQENTSAWYAERLKDTFGNNIFDKDDKLTNENALRDRLLKMYNQRSAKVEKDFKNAQKEYNNWINNVWNKMSKAQQEANQALKDKKDKQIKNAEEKAKNGLKDIEDWYKQNEEYIQNYKKALEEAVKDEAELAKIRQEFLDNKIARFQMQVDLAIDTGNFERDWLEFEKKFIKKIRKDDIFGQALYDSKRFQSYFDSSEISTRAQQIAQLQQQIAQMEAGTLSQIYSEEGVPMRLEQARERLQKLLEDQMKDYEQLQEIAEDMMDHYLDALDDAKDKMDEHVDQYERVNSLIEHNVKLTQLLYGDKAYDTMDKYYDMQKSNNETILQTLRAEQLYWQNMLANEQVGSDAWKNIKQHLDQTTDDLNSKLEDIIENLSDQWQNRVNGIIDKLNNALTGGRGTSYLDEEWDYINKWDDTFLDPVESRMGINEIQSLYQQAVDGLSGSPKQQQKMNKLMSDQLKLLREKDNLTQYDLDRAKAALEVEKARLALEDSRMNKNRMRLRRDSQGNYTYQYVADEQKLDDLQKQLSDAQANLYNMDKEHYKETLNDLYDTYKDYINKMKDLTKQYNATQDEEERARIEARMKLLNEQYGKYYDAVTKDNQFNRDMYLGFSTLAGLGLDAAQYTTEQIRQIVRDTVPQAQSAITDLRDAVSGEGGLLASTKDAMQAIAQATEEYDANVKQMLETAGTSLQTVSQVTDAYGNALDRNITQAQEITGYYADMVNKSVEAVENVKNLLDVIEKGLNSIDQDTIDSLAKAYDLVLSGSYGVGKEVEINGEKTSLVNANIPTPDTELETAILNTRLSDMTSSDLENYLSTQATSHSLELVSQSLENIANMGIEDLASEDLNSVVNMVKGITNYLGNFATMGLDSLMKEASSYIGTIDNVEHLDQNVHIEAHFPNVVNHTEIEAAINNLVNIASQKAATNAG